MMAQISEENEYFDPKTARAANVCRHVTVEKVRKPNVYAVCYGCYTLYPREGGRVPS
jgi:hypothetical protein